MLRLLSHWSGGRFRQTALVADPRRSPAKEARSATAARSTDGMPANSINCVIDAVFLTIQIGAVVRQTIVVADAILNLDHALAQHQNLCRQSLHLRQ